LDIKVDVNTVKTYLQTWANKLASGWPFVDAKIKQVGQLGVSIDRSGVAVIHQHVDAAGVMHFNVCEFSACEEFNHRTQVLTNIVTQYSLQNSTCVYVLQPGEYQLFLLEAPNVDAHELKSAYSFRTLRH